VVTTYKSHDADQSCFFCLLDEQEIVRPPFQQLWNAGVLDVAAAVVPDVGDPGAVACEEARE
jgi:hypothetical protein